MSFHPKITKSTLTELDCYQLLQRSEKKIKMEKPESKIHKPLLHDINFTLIHFRSVCLTTWLCLGNKTTWLGLGKSGGGQSGRGKWKYRCVDGCGAWGMENEAEGDGQRNKL